MKKRILISISFFLLILSTSIIIATPPSGNYTVGTHWCENSAVNGPQEYVYDGGGKWSGPYKCPGGCTSLGIGGNCAAPTPKKGDTTTESSDSDECRLVSASSSDYSAYV